MRRSEEIETETDREVTGGKEDKGRTYMRRREGTATENREGDNDTERNKT